MLRSSRIPTSTATSPEASEPTLPSTHPKMVTTRFLTSCLALAAQYTNACNLEARQDDAAAGNNGFFTVGTDGSAQRETLGFFLNHLSLIVSNLTASKEFYGNVLGMRHMFTAQLSPHYSVTYMGHAQGGRNGTGFQTGEELLRNKNNAAGLLELQFLENAADQEERLASTRRANTFSHLGLVVPSLEKAQEWFDSHGVNVTKRIGETAGENDGVRNALGIGEAALTNQTEKDLLNQGQELVGFPQLLVVEDPDGNMIEVQQLVPPPGVA
jgi:lactoylglutathione lyase